MLQTKCGVFPPFLAEKVLLLLLLLLFVLARLSCVYFWLELKLPWVKIIPFCFRLKIKTLNECFSGPTTSRHWWRFVGKMSPLTPKNECYYLGFDNFLRHIKVYAVHTSIMSVPIYLNWYNSQRGRKSKNKILAQPAPCLETRQLRTSKKE